MAQKEGRSGPDLGSVFGSVLPQNLLAAGAQQIEWIGQLQKQFQAICEQASRQAADRASAEMDLAKSLGEKIAAAKSPTDAAQAYQDWLNRRMQLYAEDGQQVAADAQKFVTMWAGMLSGIAPKP
jgi:hypothetical protein